MKEVREPEEEQVFVVESNQTEVAGQEREIPKPDISTAKDTADDCTVSKGTSRFWGLRTMDYDDIMLELGLQEDGLRGEQENPALLDLMEIDEAAEDFEEQPEAGGKTSEVLELPEKLRETRKRGLEHDNCQRKKKTRFALPTIEEEIETEELEIPEMKLRRIKNKTLETRRLVAEKSRLPEATREVEFYFAGKKRKSRPWKFSHVVRRLFDEYNLKLQGLE